MKKYLMLGIVLLTMSCSSDDKDEIDTPSQGLTQYDVNIKIPKQEFSESENGNRYNGGNMGVLVYGEILGYIAFDRACPVEWNLEKENRGELTYASIMNGNGHILCKKCNSRFTFPSMEATSGKAKELGYKLVDYNVKFDENTQEYHITNPNYKK